MIDDIFFMFFLENVALADKSVKINIHMFEDKIDVLIIISFHYFLEGDDVGMFELLQEHNFSVDSLRIGGVREGIKIFLKGFESFSFPIRYFPHMPIGTTPYLLYYLVF